ncbi:MAG TPA: phosphotransferase [Patescibacteria group bacterium]|nr:phosphotransferase [Patescibacteria group bacterium]
MPEINEHRQKLREDFIAKLGWKNITLEALPADASFRRYYRLVGANKPMLLMQDPPDRPPVPPFVMVEPFVAIAEQLRTLGLRSPEIYARDIPNGLLVIEDFGDDTYTRLLNRNLDAKPLYEMAVDVLSHLHRHPARNDLGLPAYNEKQLIEEAMLLVDWYYPAVSGKLLNEGSKESFREVWRNLFTKFPADQTTLVLRDYHVDNLMLCTDGDGISRCGLLDFQDALTGVFSYDLMSLLEDARRDVPQDLQEHLLERYFKAMGSLDRDAFTYSYRVLAAQRHAKVLGIFVRLFVRDGKDRYLQFIPHVHKLFINAINDPALATLKAWFDVQGFDIAIPFKMLEK